MPHEVIVTARDEVGAPPERLFELLADLDRHRALTDRGMEVVRLHGPSGRRTGGVVELRGPLGLRRQARTEVGGAEPLARLWGSATTPNGTAAELEWSLEPRGPKTAVQLEMRIAPRALTDRVLLRFGAAQWLERRMRASLARLDALATTR